MYVSAVSIAVCGGAFTIGQSAHMKKHKNGKETGKETYGSFSMPFSAKAAT